MFYFTQVRVIDSELWQRFLRKGQEWTENWLNENVKMMAVDEHLTHVMAEFAKFSKLTCESPSLGRKH